MYLYTPGIATLTQEVVHQRAQEAGHVPEAVVDYCVPGLPRGLERKVTLMGWPILLADGNVAVLARTVPDDPTSGVWLNANYIVS